MPIDRKLIAMAAVALLLNGCAARSAGGGTDDALVRMMSGQSELQGANLERAIAKAEAFPLGSDKNPVRTSMPEGERAYLNRLRCSDGSPPTFDRLGSTGAGPYGNIMDIYSLRCAGGNPATASVFMDMYHNGFQEVRAVPAFTIAP